MTNAEPQKRDRDQAHRDHMRSYMRAKRESVAPPGTIAHMRVSLRKIRTLVEGKEKFLAKQIHQIATEALSDDKA